jgi:hypothetical protein
MAESQPAHNILATYISTNPCNTFLEQWDSIASCNNWESAIPIFEVSFDGTHCDCKRAVASTGMDLPLWRLLSHPCLQPRAGVCYQAPRLFATHTPTSSPWHPMRIFLHFRSSTGHLLMQSWRSHQHHRDDSPCSMPTSEHDPAFSFRRGGQRTLPVVNLDIYINRAGHALDRV